MGLGNVQFGMSPTEVLANFSEEQTFEDWMGGNLNDAISFHRVIFLFDRCNSIGPLPDSSMDQFVVRNRSEIQLWGRPFGYWSRDLVVDYLSENEISFSASVALNIDVNSQSLSLTFDAHGILLEVAGGNS